MPMKLRISLPMPIVLCLLTIVIVAVSPAVAAGDNKAKSATSTPDIAPDTVLLKIQLEENKPPLELTLKQLMETYNIPGLSVAVVDNYQIVWAKGFGVTEHGGKSPVTTRTLFQAGSISKPVAAVGAMWLVEHGKLKTFQRNVQEYPH